MLMLRPDPVSWDDPKAKHPCFDLGNHKRVYRAFGFVESVDPHAEHISAT